MASADLREELNCSICLSIYTDPVMLSCGHNFCQGCIGSVLDTQEGSGVYTCPECRAEYQERPAPQRNLKLCNIAERFLTNHPEQEETEIFCTYCDSPVPAAKTCLHCDASLCDKHLKKHSKSPEHVLMEPTISLEKRKCSIHQKLLEYYCTEDAVCVCVSCFAFGDHKGHQVELINEASEKKKVKLRNVLEKLTSKRKNTEKRVQSLEEHRREVQGKAAGVRERVTALIMDIRKQLEALEKRVLEEITRQQEEVILQVSDLIQQLEREKDELSMKMSHIELCNMTDPITVLQREVRNTECGDKDLPAPEELDEVLISVRLHRALSDIVTDVKAKTGLCEQEAPDILLDVNTACCYMSVSGDLKTAANTYINQERPYSPESFVTYCQVLSTNSFTSGRHYWEVETSESGDWRVGLAYPSIKREGEASLIGNNNRSWCLRHFKKKHSVQHNSILTPLTPESSCTRLGIYLDYEAGRLSFYHLCDPIRLLHTFTASFTEPLHAAFYVHRAWVRIKRGRIGKGNSQLIANEQRKYWCLPGLKEALCCGQNLCQGCIKSALTPTGVYTCPEYRASLQECPAMYMAMDLYNTYDVIPPNQSMQESDEIFCTYCVHSQVPAAKSCLLCEASLCDIHVNVHSKSEQHVLTEPTKSWVNRKCPIHREVLKYYCTEDAVSVCVSCSLAGAHQGHQVELLDEASEKKKNKLRNIMEKITSEREEIEKRVQSLQQQRYEVEDKATGLKEQVTSLLMEVMNEITRQEEQILLPVSDLIQQMEKEKEELSREMSRIEKLCNMTDPLLIIQDQELHNTDFCDPDKRIIEGTKRYGNNFTTGDDFNENLISEILKKGLANIGKNIKTRQMSYVQKASRLLIDVSTAGNNVSVSQDLKMISRSEINQQRPNKTERFLGYPQALSITSFSLGRHYWEVETSEHGKWRVGMAYRSMERQGRRSSIGGNNKSWCLRSSDKNLSVLHDSIETQLPHKSSIQRFGISLDYEAGHLSFYELCDPIRHLHTFTATFTEPLHAAFWVFCEKSWVKIKS
ncbi:LOW QUALITY PROTEIN: uncharacterized protein O3C94_019033 [Discoglossus pictus]